MAAKERFTKVFAIDPVPERMGELLQPEPQAESKLMILSYPASP